MKKTLASLSRKRVVLILVVLAALLALALAACQPANTGDGAAPSGDGGSSSSGGGTSPSGGGSSPSGGGDVAPEDMPELWIFTSVGRIQMEGLTGSDQANLDMVTQYVMDNVGVKLNAVVPPQDVWQERLAIRLASGDPIDLFQGDWRSYRSTGAIMDLTPYFENGKLAFYDEVYSQYEPDWRSSVSDSDGRIWAFTDGSALACHPIYVRKDWCDQLGLKIPTTIEELEVVLEAFASNDMSGTGETIPLLTGMQGETNIMTFWCLAGGWLPQYQAGNWITSDKTVMPREMHPGYEGYVAKMADWFQKGWIYNESYQINRARTAELISANKVGATALWYTYTTSPLNDLWENVPEAEYVACPLKGPEGWVQVAQIPRIGGGTLVSAKTPDMDVVCKYINWLHEDIENYIVVRNGIKDVNWKYVPGFDGSDGNYRMIEWVDQHGYIGEYEMGGDMYHTMNYFFGVNGELAPNAQYLLEYGLNFDLAKVQGDVYTYYDLDRINEIFPYRGDFNRISAEEQIKFITGARPMSEWPNFMNELKAVGVDQWIAAYTEQYREQNP